MVSKEQYEHLCKLALDEEYKTTISAVMVEKALIFLENRANSKEEYFQLLATLNLLNAAIKRKEYKNQILYGTLKRRVSYLLIHLSNRQIDKMGITFFINPDENCAYIEVFEFQFSFHNIMITEALNQFTNSPKNIIVPWKGIRLQRIAGELFDLAFQINKVE